VFIYLAHTQASAIVDDAGHDPTSGAPCQTPCHTFDHDYDLALQDAGQRWSLIANISLGVGITAGAVAGYYWYLQSKAKPHAAEAKPAPKGGGFNPEALYIGPSISNGFAGAAAAARF
jgi:hypothetical protein